MNHTPDSAAERRRGLRYALGCYAVWGLFPLYWFPLKGAMPAEQMLAQRVVWSAVFALVLLLCYRQGGAVLAVLRRPRTSTTPPQVTTPLIVGDLILDPVAHQVRVGETTVELTRTEFELLVALALRPGQALTRHDLVTEVWDTTWVGDERIVDVHIGNLRRKLGTDTRGRGFIDTVRGVGYRVGQP